MANIPVSSFLGAASQVMLGSLLGKAQGEQAAAQQQAEQEAAQQQQQHFLRQMHLAQARLDEETRAHKAEEENRAQQRQQTEEGLDIRRTGAANTQAARQSMMGFRTLKELDAGRNQAQNRAQREYQAAVNRAATPEAADAAWQVYQQNRDEIDRTYGQQRSALLAEATPAPAGTAPAQPAAAPAAPARLRIARPGPTVAQARLKQGERRLTDTEAEALRREAARKQRLADAETNAAERQRYQQAVLRLRRMAEARQERGEQRQERAETFREKNPRGGANAQTQAVRQAAALEKLIEEPNFGKRDPESRQMILRRYQDSLAKAGQKADAQFLAYAERKAKLPTTAAGKGSGYAFGPQDRKDRQDAIHYLTEKDADTGLLKHNPAVASELPRLSRQFGIAYSKSSEKQRQTLQDDNPDVYQYWLAHQPKGTPKAPAPAQPKPQAAPRRGVPVRPAVTSAAELQPPAATAQQPPPVQTPREVPKTPPSRGTSAPTEQPMVVNLGGKTYDLTLKGHVQTPQGEDPKVWEAVRTMPNPYPENSPQWIIWRRYIGRGESPKEIVGMGVNHDERLVIRNTLKEINDDYLSGKKLQPATGGQTPATAGAVQNANPGVKFAQNAQGREWETLRFPQGVTHVWGLGPNQGIMRIGGDSHNFVVRNGRVVDLGLTRPRALPGLTRPRTPQAAPTNPFSGTFAPFGGR